MIIEKALERNPLESTFHAFLADQLWKRDEREEAFKTLTRAVELLPEYDWGWETLIRWSKRMQQPERVIELARKLTADHENDIQSWLVLARTLKQFENLPEQLETLEKAIQLAPPLHRNV